jgi:prepilin-type processing-associated H-X9-DG protein
MFFVMSNELNTPKVLYCPTETIDTLHAKSTTWNGAPTTDAGYTNDANVSYFVGVDADDSGSMVTAGSRVFLTGDRFMGTSTVGPPVIPPAGLTSIYYTTAAGSTFYCEPLITGYNSAGLPTVLAAAWATDVGHGSVGNIAMTDGSVTGFSTSALQSAVRNSGDPNHLASASPSGTGMPAGGVRLQFPAM